MAFNLFGKKAPARPESFETLLRVLEQGDLSGSDVRERCRLAKHIQDYIVKTAAAHGLHSTTNGYADKIEEQHFGREIAQAKRLFESLEFSPALHTMLAEKTIAFADAFRAANPVMTLQDAWNAANGTMRHEKLTHFLQTQCKTFGGIGDHDFAPSGIDMKPVRRSIRGAFNAAAQDINIRSTPPILLNETELDDGPASMTYSTLFHEQIHGILWQLGYAAHHALIEKDHPLYNDADIMQERIKTITRDNPKRGLKASPSIESLYAADPEEKACHLYENLFLSRCGFQAPAPPETPAPKSWLGLFPLNGKSPY